MTRRSSFVASSASFVLVSPCKAAVGGFFSEEREPWRAEAEIACLKSGAVKEKRRTGAG